MSNHTSLLSSLKSSDQDFEWYPTTSRMIDAISKRLNKTLNSPSILDIGAGDGRVLTQLSSYFDSSTSASPQLYAIEKSQILLHSQPENIIPVGTDLFEQNLACLPVDYIFCNPPYSQYESWSSLIIESGYAKKAFLIIPQRWKENPAILQSLKSRGATYRVLHSDNFLDAERKARAVIDIVEISYPYKDNGYRDEIKDPFDIWFDQNISTFDTENEDPSITDKYQTDYERERQALSKIRHLKSISDMVESYREEYSRMEENYKSIFRLDYVILRELGVNKENVREGIKKKMSGLKSKYWTLLFERFHPITSRLSTATRSKFADKLLSRSVLAFTSDNAYAVVLWSIKNANKYFDEQTIQLYRDLSTFDGVLNYKSNIKTWEKNDWRYYHADDDDQRPAHYALDYRIVVERFRGVFSGGYDSYNYLNDLAKSCHDLIADIIAVLHNLGFPTLSPGSMDRGTWIAGQWQDWYGIGSRSDEILFQVKGHKNGNLHFRFLPEVIKALNVEAGRLLKWLKSPEEVAQELGYSKEEAEKLYNSTQFISLSGSRLLLKGINEEDAEAIAAVESGDKPQPNNIRSLFGV